jgi:hypothetical protein
MAGLCRIIPFTGMAGLCRIIPFAGVAGLCRMNPLHGLGPHVVLPVPWALPG